MPNRKKTLTLSNELLGDIEMAMKEGSYETEWYLDTREQEVNFLADPMLTGEPEENKKLERQIEQDEEDRFVPVPPITSREGWKQMEQFIFSLDDLDKTTRNLLLNTIQGKGAFGRFKEAIYEIGIQDKWYAFRGREDRKIVLNWLHSFNLITDDQIEEGLQMYEDELQRRNQRKEEIANMCKRTQVICRSTHGHEDQLTVGKIYDVLDEQKQHLNRECKSNSV